MYRLTPYPQYFVCGWIIWYCFLSFTPVSSCFDSSNIQQKNQTNQHKHNVQYNYCNMDVQRPNSSMKVCRWIIVKENDLKVLMLDYASLYTFVSSTNYWKLLLPLHHGFKRIIKLSGCSYLNVLVFLPSTSVRVSTQNDHSPIAQLAGIWTSISTLFSFCSTIRPFHLLDSNFTSPVSSTLISPWVASAMSGNSPVVINNKVSVGKHCTQDCGECTKNISLEWNKSINQLHPYFYTKTHLLMSLLINLSSVKTINTFFTEIP